MFKIISIFIISISNFAAAAAPVFYERVNLPVSAALAVALKEYSQVRPGAVTVDGPWFRLLNESGAVAIECRVERPTLCRFEENLDNRQPPFIGTPRVDQVVFDALLNLQRSTSTAVEVIQAQMDLYLSGNRNRTFLKLEGALGAPGSRTSLSEFIACNATPAPGGGFREGTCKYHIPNVTTGAPAGELLQQLRTNSSLSQKLAQFTEAAGWVVPPTQLSKVDYLDYKRYAWTELHVMFAKPQPPAEGEVWNVSMNIFTHAPDAAGRRRVERVQESYEHRVTITPRS